MCINIVKKAVLIKRGERDREREKEKQPLETMNSLSGKLYLKWILLADTENNFKLSLLCPVKTK